MKKMFLFAAAAMVSLSSCVQTEEVYTGKLNEMGFKSAVTRGIIQSNNDMTYPIAVSAILDNGTKYNHYFLNDGIDQVERPYVAKFVYDPTHSYWKGEPARYWPTSGEMEFLAFCPYPVYASIATNLNASTGKFESMVVEGIDNNKAEQSDILYSDLLKATAPDDAHATQPLFFHHACAQINLTFKKTDSQADVIVNQVAITNVKLMGTLTITPTDTQVSGSDKKYLSTAVWSNVTNYPTKNFLKENPTTLSDSVLDMPLDSATAYSPTPLLVIPDAQTSLHIVYTVDGHQQIYTHDLSANGDKWEMGKKYTYNFTINVNEILFDCTVEDWKEGNVTPGGDNITI